MVSHMDLFWASKSYNEMSCDSTGRHPVLSGNFCPLWECQSQLFHGQVGDAPLRCYLYKALE